MKKRTFTAISALGLVLGTLAGVGISAEATIAIVPQPVRVERKEGAFTLNKDTRILVQQGSAGRGQRGETVGGPGQCEHWARA